MCIHLCPHESASDANCSPSVTPNLALNMQTGITESVKDATVYVSSELGETVPRMRDHDGGLIPAANHYDRGGSSSCPPIPPSGTRTETRPRLAHTSRAREPSGPMDSWRTCARSINVAVVMLIALMAGNEGACSMTSRTTTRPHPAALNNRIDRQASGTRARFRSRSRCAAARRTEHYQSSMRDGAHLTCTTLVGFVA